MSFGYNTSPYAPWGVALADIRYPVIKFNPSPMDGFRALRLRDYGSIIGYGAATLPLSYIWGRSGRKDAMIWGAALGLVGGLVIVTKKSVERLQGVAENSNEVSKYGHVYLPKDAVKH